jgi:hypothetical protein
VALAYAASVLSRLSASRIPASSAYMRRSRVYGVRSHRGGGGRRRPSSDTLVVRALLTLAAGLAKVCKAELAMGANLRMLSVILRI